MRLDSSIGLAPPLFSQRGNDARRLHTTTPSLNKNAMIDEELHSILSAIRLYDDAQKQSQQENPDKETAKGEPSESVSASTTAMDSSYTTASASDNNENVSLFQELIQFQRLNGLPDHLKEEHSILWDPTEPNRHGRSMSIGSSTSSLSSGENVTATPRHCDTLRDNRESARKQGIRRESLSRRYFADKSSMARSRSLCAAPKTASMNPPRRTSAPGYTSDTRSSLRNPSKGFHGDQALARRIQMEWNQDDVGENETTCFGM